MADQLSSDKKQRNVDKLNALNGGGVTQRMVDVKNEQGEDTRVTDDDPKPKKKKTKLNKLYPSQDPDSVTDE